MDSIMPTFDGLTPTWRSGRAARSTTSIMSESLVVSVTSTASRSRHHDPEHRLETEHPVGDEDVKDKDRHQKEQGRTKLMERIPPRQAGGAEQAGDDQELHGMNRNARDREECHACGEEDQELRPRRDPVNEGVAGHVERQHHAIARR